MRKKIAKKLPSWYEYCDNSSDEEIPRKRVRLPDPTEPPSKTNKPEAFHVYSMRQAIEEGFILDVLKNYTSYKVCLLYTSPSPRD